MPEPLSRLQMARDEINKTFGPDFAEQHPELVIAVMNAASSDWAAARLGAAIGRVAIALAEPQEEDQHIVPARELLRARP
jgi:hypothetical protein